MIQVFLGLTKNSVLMDGKGPNLHLPKYMQSNMYPLGCKGIKRSQRLRTDHGHPGNHIFKIHYRGKTFHSPISGDKKAESTLDIGK